LSEQFIVLALLVVAALLLATERLRPDLVAMLVLAALVVLRILGPSEALSGFASPATVTVACMFVISAGLQTSGVVHWVGDRLISHGPSSKTGLLLLTALVVVPVSAFINNTAAVAVFLPVVTRACHDRHVSPSKLMMPLSFLAMIGGTCTLIGTTTNIVVSSIAERQGLLPFSMFEFTNLGLLLLLAGVTYLLVFGQRLIPERVQAESLTEGFHLNRFLSEVVVLQGSPLIGQTPLEARLGERHDLEVLGHVRDREVRSAHESDTTLAEGDILLVKAPAAALVRLRDAAGIAVRPGRHPDDAELRSGDAALFEAVITPNSELVGRNLKRVNFRNRFGATALAIRRHGEEILEKIGKIRLRLGDELLVMAPRRNLERLRRETNFLVLEELDLPVVRPLAALTAIAIVIGIVAVVSLGLYPIATAAIVGAVLMVLTGCMPVRRVYDHIDWQVVFLLAGLLPLGLALESSGAASQAVGWIVGLSGEWGPRAVLGLFFLLASLLTGFMSNNATAALLAPLAISCADALGVSPRPFLIALTFAASAAFYTPIGYQTNLLVYGPGGYRFFDFMRAGGPLTLLYGLLATLLIPVLFPF
jgi:di/tricarboxylate transporter